jgi:hypothetical protein
MMTTNFIDLIIIESWRGKDARAPSALTVLTRRI